MTLERLGKFEIRGILGQGAMGLVYDGWDPGIGRRVAIKTVPLAARDDPDAAEAVERFRREAQAAGKLIHPNIVGVFDFGETETLAYIVMEFMDDGTVKELLDRETLLVPARACALMAHVLDALSHSHNEGVVHRDVKPANILLNKRGAVKLGDFGIARIESSSMTLVGDVLGTPAYMAPEQFLGETADARSDIFAAGATLFHLLTGVRPYEGSRTTVRQKVLTAAQAPAASERNPQVPSALDAVLQRAMARQPADRFQTAQDFRGALRPWLQNGTVGALSDSDGTILLRATKSEPVAEPQSPATSASGRQRKAGLAVVAAILLAAATAGGGWYFNHTVPAIVSQPTPNKISAEPAPSKKPDARQPIPNNVQRQLQLMSLGSVPHAAVAAETAIEHIDCALGQVDTTDSGLHVAAIVGAGKPEETLVASMEQQAHGFPITWSKQIFHGPYCPALRSIRTAWNFGKLTLGLQDQADNSIAPTGTVLHDGMLMKPVIGALHFDSYVRVDDVQADGTVTHIYPRVAEGGIPSDPVQILPAGRTLVLGTKPRTIFQVGKPFGTDMIIAVATGHKLSLKKRPNVESAAPYLAALQDAIDHSNEYPGLLAAAAMPVQTEP